MQNIAIIDDDIHFLEMIKNKLSFLNKNFNIYYYTRPYDFLENIDKINYLLLDIDLPQIDGISFSKQIRNNHLSIFFITSYKELMIKAFGKNVEGFILKDDLDVGIDNFIKFINRTRKNNCIEVYIHRQNIHLYYDDIIYISYSLRDIEYHLMNNKTFLHKNANLKDILCKLGDEFILINRNTIVNLNFINKYKNGFVYIRNNKFKVSRRKLKNLEIKLLERELNNGC